MNEDLHSAVADKALISEPELASARALRSRRLTLFISLAALTSSFYAFHDCVLGSYETATLHALAAISQGIARYQQTKRKNLDLASHWLLVSMFLNLGITPLFDGNIRSPGLWCISVLPVAASLLFGRRAVLRYAIGVALVIVLQFLASFFIPPEKLITRQPEQWAVMRVALLLVFAGMSLASATASRRARKQISNRTQALETQAQDANVAERSKSTILATMSHEVRMPVQGVLDLVFQSRDLGFNARHSFAFETMGLQAKRVLRLLDALLDLANLQAGRAKLQEQSFALGALLERVHLKHEASAKEKNIAIHTRLALGPRIFIGDANRIYQLVSALVSNAIKFSDRGKIEVLAHFQNDSYDPGSQEQMVVISVKDEGIGMNPEQLSRVFGQFEQVHENLDAQRGSWGLGLAIAHQISQSMQGKLEATSEPGKGSTFTLTLPLKEDEAVSNSWSACLQLDELQALASKSPPPELKVDKLSRSEQKQVSLLRSLTTVVLPLIAVCCATELSMGHTISASIHGACIAALGLVCLTVSPFQGALRSFIFLSAVTLSMSSQALLDGTVQSEVLWTIGLIPVLASFLFNLRLSFICLGSTIGLVGYLLFSPSITFNEVYLGSGISTTLMLRLASLFAYAGCSFAISKSDSAMVTELRRQQVSVDRLHKVAISSNREKDHFLARIRLELGTPILHLMRMAKGLGQDEALDAPQRSQLKAITQSAGKIGQLIGRTIDYAMDDEAKPQGNAPAPFDLRELMLDICRMFSPSANQNRRFIQFVDYAQDTLVQGDASGVFEVVAVLLTHAIRSADPGPIFISLSQTSRSSDHQQFDIEIRCSGLHLSAQQRSLIESRSSPKAGHRSIQEFRHDPVLRGLVAAQACGGSIHLPCTEPTTNDHPACLSELKDGLVFRIELPPAQALEQRQAA